MLDIGQLPARVLTAPVFREAASGDYNGRAATTTPCFQLLHLLSPALTFLLYTSCYDHYPSPCSILPCQFPPFLHPSCQTSICCCFKLFLFILTFIFLVQHPAPPLVQPSLVLLLRYHFRLAQVIPMIIF